MYVVTGATGNTGSIVANTLLAHGQQVRAIGRSAERLTPLASKGAEPFVADLSDAEALTRAFTGAKAAYVMVPPDIRTQNYDAYQDRISEAVAAAIEKARLQHAVLLSSIGADKPEKTGPVAGLHRLEQRLNRIAGLNVLHLRPGYFMENLLPQTGVIKAYGIVSEPLRPDLKLPMIATRDIAAFAAQVLLWLDFRGQQARELLGERDLSMTEATAIIGKAINKPGLTYTQATDEEFRSALTQMGASVSAANLLLEMSAALNSGYMRALERRSPQNTTPTSFEIFVAEEFVPAYQRHSAAA